MCHGFRGSNEIVFLCWCIFAAFPVLLSTLLLSDALVRELMISLRHSSPSIAFCMLLFFSMSFHIIVHLLFGWAQAAAWLSHETIKCS